MAVSAVKSVLNVPDFEQILEEAGSDLTVVHFAADWAPQCKQMNAVLTELSKDNDLNSVKFLQVEAESLAELSQKHGISAVPTFVFFKNKTEIHKVHGANAPELTKSVQKYASTGSGIPLSVKAPVQDINVKLKKLVNAATCMLFMKGNPHEPRCGFSRQIVAILDSKNAEYSTFDILSDEAVRQGLKEYSKWPTFPQLYIKGELVGGLDIVKEMDEAGELDEMLVKKCSLDDRLTSLINKAPIMVFMKGDANMPRCGFSKQVIAILNDAGVKYDTFDILEDEDIRQGLKKFSNWPTYPQLYVNGSLIGGLDIIKELKEAEELVDVLQPKA